MTRERVAVGLENAGRSPLPCRPPRSGCPLPEPESVGSSFRSSVESIGWFTVAPVFQFQDLHGRFF